MKPGTARDSAIQAISRTLAKENPADAVTWAGAIFNNKERIEVQVEIARRWQAASRPTLKRGSRQISLRKLRPGQ